MDEPLSRLLDRALRKRRSDYALDHSSGLYALFLAAGSRLPEFDLQDEALIYIGKADGARGLKGRCHFRGGTRNHSPRKSLSVILGETLDLHLVRVNERGGAYKTWQLDPASERRLDGWMHEHLRLAILPMDRPAQLEKQLIAETAPLLNLTECAQSESHLRISARRRAIEATLRSS